MAEERRNNGIIVKKVHPNAPKFARCKISFNVDNFINTLRQNNAGGWVNMDVNESDKGELYAKINTWQPQQQAQQAPPVQQNQQKQSQFTPDNNLARTDEQGPLPTEPDGIAF